MASEQEVLEKLVQAGRLPTIPAVALRIVRLSEDPQADMDALAEAMEKDPALVRLGTRGARLIALSFGLIDSCQRHVTDFDFPSFWRRCLTVAVCARRMAGCWMPRLAEEAFVAGLLADIGCPVLARMFPPQYRSVSRIHESSPRRLVDIELNYLGLSHPKVTAAILQSCKLPESMVDAVKAHHDASALEPEDPAYPIAALVMTASELADLIIQGSTTERVQELATMFRRLLSLSAEHLDALLDDLEPEVTGVGQLLELPLPPVHVIQAAAKREALRLAILHADDAPVGAAAPGTSKQGDSAA